MKNLRNFTAITFLLFAFTTQAQQWNKSNTVSGNGNVITKTYQTSGYDEILVGGNFHVTLVAGTEGNITVKAEENLMEHIIIESNGNTLTIKTEDNTNLKPARRNKMEVTVPFNTLNKINLAGSGEIMSNKNVVANSLEIRVAGSGTINVPVETEDLQASLAGSGNMTLNGRARNVVGRIAGSGDIDLTQVRTENADISVTGSGDFKVNCIGDLKAKIAGSGNVRYKNTPKSIDKKVAGSGKIIKI